MAAQFRLQPLLELAQQRSEDAAQMLQRLKLVWQEAELKLNQLENYLGEYRQRLQENMRDGVAMAQWRDCQAFIAKLEIAVKTQAEEVEHCHQRWSHGQIEWQAREREAKAYGKLRERHGRVERANEVRQEQKQQDEFARNQHQRKTHTED